MFFNGCIYLIKNTVTTVILKNIITIFLIHLIYGLKWERCHGEGGFMDFSVVFHISFEYNWYPNLILNILYSVATGARLDKLYVRKSEMNKFINTDISEWFFRSSYGDFRLQYSKTFKDISFIAILM